MISKELRSSDAYTLKTKDFNIYYYTYNGDVKKLTWLQATDIKSEIYKL